MDFPSDKAFDGRIVCDNTKDTVCFFYEGGLRQSKNKYIRFSK